MSPLASVGPPPMLLAIFCVLALSAVPVARPRDRGAIVFDFAVRRGAGRIRRRGVGAQAEAGVGRAREAGRHRGEHERHDAVVRAVGHGDRSPLGRVVEHAVGVVVDPAVERGGRAGRVRDAHVDGRLGADREHQVGRRDRQAVFVVRQRTVDIIRVGGGVLQRAVVAVDVRTDPQAGDDRVATGHCRSRRVL